MWEAGGFRVDEVMGVETEPRGQGLSLVYTPESHAGLGKTVPPA